MTLTWNNRRFDWVNVTYFTVIHLIALTAFWHFSWTGFAIAAVGWWIAGSLGICFTFHRLLTHRGFKVPKAIEYLGTLFGTLASEGGAISWVAMHRIHHAKSDEPGKDIHTPKDGFWWSHMGWIVCDIGMDRRAMERRWAPEMVADPVHRFLNRFHIFPNILVGLALYAWGGWSIVVWGVFVRMVVTLHGTWLVNSATHTWGYRTWRTNEDSRNLWWVGLLAWGEGWHNTHHAFQRSARHGFEWWEIDTTWMVIRALAAVGLVKDIHLLPKNAERFRITAEQPDEAVPPPLEPSRTPGSAGAETGSCPPQPACGRGRASRGRIPLYGGHIMFGLGMGELVVILVILILIFGTSRLASLGKGLGEGIRNFKKGVKDEDESGDQPKAS